MKFSFAALIFGVVLIIAPLLAYSYQLHVVEMIARSVLAQNGSFSYPEVPTLFYCISCAVGVALIAVGCIMEHRSVRSAKGLDVHLQRA